jgi:hypothetical protein
VTRVQVNHAHGWMVWSERVLLVALLLLFVTKGFIPAWKHLKTDFPNYYLGARLYRQGYPMERVYEWTWFQRQRDHLEIDQRLVSFIPFTLPSMLPVMPWCSLPPLQAKHFWLLMNVLFLLGTALFLRAEQPRKNPTGRGQVKSQVPSMTFERPVLLPTTGSSSARSGRDDLRSTSRLRRGCRDVDQADLFCPLSSDIARWAVAGV